MIHTLEKFADFDNALYRTDKFTSHSYLEIYEEVLAPKKETAKNILEIGVSAGGSILMWRDFFVNAQVYGIDIIDTPQDIINNGQERITLIKNNAYDINFVRQNFIDKNMQFDIIVDDGPHSLESMKFFATHYSSLLAPGGILVVEDIPTMDWPHQIINCFPEHLRTKTRVVDIRHIKGKWDDILVILQT